MTELTLPAVNARQSQYLNYVGANNQKKIIKGALFNNLAFAKEDKKNGSYFDL